MARYLDLKVGNLGPSMILCYSRLLFLVISIMTESMTSFLYNMERLVVPCPTIINVQLDCKLVIQDLKYDV